MNIFDQKTKLFTEEQIKNRIDRKTSQLFKDKPFRVRAYPVFIIALGLTLLCQVLSGATELYMLVNWFASFPLIAAVLIGCILMIAIEGLKRWASNDFILLLSSHGQIAKFSFVLLAFMQVASVFISYKGAQQLPKEIITAPTKQTASIIDLKALEAKHGAKIEEQTKAINKYFNDNKKSNGLGGYRLSSRYMDHYNKMIQHKQSLEGALILAITEAKQANIKSIEGVNNSYIDATKEYNNRLTNEGALFGLISLIIEGVFLLSFGVMFYYLKRSHNEKNATQNERTNSKRTDERPIYKSVHKNEQEERTANEQPQHVTLISKQERTPPTFKDFNNTFVIDCVVCGTKKQTPKADTKYCSSSCRGKAYRLRNKTKS